jgi:hypothetical protein
MSSSLQCIGVATLLSRFAKRRQTTLKRMENLVQDLQDELEMKEDLTVKEFS